MSFIIGYAVNFVFYKKHLAFSLKIVYNKYNLYHIGNKKILNVRKEVLIYMDLWLDQEEMIAENPFMKGFYHILNGFYYSILIVLLGWLIILNFDVFIIVMSTLISSVL